MTEKERIKQIMKSRLITGLNYFTIGYPSDLQKSQKEIYEYIMRKMPKDSRPFAMYILPDDSNMEKFIDVFDPYCDQRDICRAPAGALQISI